MNHHPGAWLIWLGAVCVFAFVVTNPFALATMLAVIGLIALALPSSEQGTHLKAFFVAGVVLLLFRLVFVALLPNPGSTVLFTLPRVGVSMFGLSGPVSAEVIAQAGVEGLQLIVVVSAFGLFNSRVDTGAAIRLVPIVFRDTGLVVSIASGFIPSMLATVGDIKDAQRMRGEHGVRRLSPSLAIPILGRTLDKAFLLAESMEARGYGAKVVAVNSAALAAGLVFCIAGIAASTAGARSGGTVLVLFGLLVLATTIYVASRGSNVTRMASRGARPRDWLMCLACLAAGIVAVRSNAGYSAFPTISVPQFPTDAIAAAALLGIPALTGK